ncbi:MAG: hypothetical protein ABUS48_00950 [Pseudomonadota bacterium]
MADRKAFTGLSQKIAPSAEELMRELEDLLNDGGYPEDRAESAQVYRQRVDAVTTTLLANIWRELIGIRRELAQLRKE